MNYGNQSVWDEGAKAARLYTPASANPYPPTDYKFVVWLNGWAFATHMREKEEEL